jgi:hypothetical protein
MDYKKQQVDLEFGFRSEEETHEYLESVFGKLMNTKDNREMGNYFEFDKYNDDYFIEMKTRRIKHNQYESLFFGVNKLDKGDELLKENPNLRIFYLWRCNDGVYGWEHNSTEFEIKKPRFAIQKLIFYFCSSKVLFYFVTNFLYIKLTTRINIKLH